MKNCGLSSVGTPFKARRRPCRPENGFSLVEMMVVVAVIAILLGFAAPAVKSMIAGQRVKNAASELYESIILARSEAIKRAVSVELDTTGFANGWAVMADGVATPLREQAAMTDVSFDPADADVSFNRLGRLAGPFEVEISRSDTASKRCIQVESSGKPKVINGACP